MVVRVYADGVYDLFHYGHARMLEQIKKGFDDVYLIVGVCQDTDVIASKRKPILTHAERCESLRHCKWVDEIIKDAPWVIDADFIEKHKIDFVAHDADPYPSTNADDVYAFVKNIGKFYATNRTEGISTTNIIERIRMI